MTNRKIGIQTDRQTERHIERQKGIKTDRKKQKDRETKRQSLNATEFLK